MSPDIERLPGNPPSPWEVAYSFSRVVQAGPFVEIGGTTSTDADGNVIGDTPYAQAKEIFRKVLAELARTGLGPESVTHTHCYVTDMSRSDEVGRAHGEAFGEVRPLFTMVEVSGLIHPKMTVEIELRAYRG
ncbi:MAG: Rid family hydrolase [Gordonia sp. (in: high G+C Gram-positive bacteria)]|uniref:Rid family hydrolase n=1 Tax=Gordonia sp. (in: high G+C Gram-positive bacteria) TaxID=84139 RepID=UPI0039E6BB08